MNIFYVSKYQRECAEALDDVRLRKMVLETAQILSTVANQAGFPTTYKPTHANHPCTRWAAQSIGNYYWLWELLNALSVEYLHRFRKAHASAVILLNVWDYLDASADDFPIKMASEPPNCTFFKDEPNLISAYRKHLNKKWREDKRPPTWTNRQPPSWKDF